MICRSCGSEVPEQTKFCIECGASQDLRCPSCSAPHAPGQKFCGECGGAAAEPSRRRCPTFRSCAWSRSCSWTSSATRRSRSRASPRTCGNCWVATSTPPARSSTRHGGTLEKFIGDAVMAVWGAPVAREDDAERAVRAGLELVEAVSALGRGGPRSGAGRPRWDRDRPGGLDGQAGEGLVVGDRVNTAARTQSAADPGTVFVDGVTREATSLAIAYEDAGEHTVKGKSEPLHLWRAVRVVAGVGGAQRERGLEPPLSVATRDAAAAQGSLPRRDRTRRRAPGDDHRRGGDRQVAPVVGVRQVRRRARRDRPVAQRPLPLLRRGDRLLGARGHRSPAARDRPGRARRDGRYSAFTRAWSGGSRIPSTASSWRRVSACCSAWPSARCRGRSCSRAGGCSSRGWPRRHPWCSCSRICSGPTRVCSRSSSTCSTGRSPARSSSSRSHATSWQRGAEDWPPARGGRDARAARAARRPSAMGQLLDALVDGLHPRVRAAGDRARRGGAAVRDGDAARALSRGALQEREGPSGGGRGARRARRARHAGRADRRAARRARAGRARPGAGDVRVRGQLPAGRGGDARRPARGGAGRDAGGRWCASRCSRSAPTRSPRRAASTAFSQGLLRTVAYERLSRRERKPRHRAAAEYLRRDVPERRRGGRRGDRLPLPGRLSCGSRRRRRPRLRTEAIVALRPGGAAGRRRSARPRPPNGPTARRPSSRTARSACR